MSVRDIFPADKSDHGREGSPPPFPLSCFGSAGGRPYAHGLQEMERGAVVKAGERPATSSPSRVLQRCFKLHPPQDPARGQAYSQCVPWLDQRQKTQGCSYVWKMACHWFCNMSRGDWLERSSFSFSALLNLLAHGVFFFLTCQFGKHSSAMCHLNCTANFQLKTRVWPSASGARSYTSSWVMKF